MDARLGGNPRQLRKAVLSIIVFVGVIQLAAIVGDMAVYRAHGRHVRSYNSPIQIAGMPLLSMGGRAHGIIAYRGLATGIIAVGGVSAGVILFGGVSVGFLSLGGLSVGWLTLGAVAVGQAALGSLAMGRWAYRGPGLARGRDEAGGKQKESLFA